MTLLSYEVIPIQENNDPLVDLSKTDLICDPAWFKQKLIDTDKMYLRQSVVEKLLSVQKVFQGYKLKIFDGFRPRILQDKIYQKFYKELQHAHPTWSKKKLIHEAQTYVTKPNDPNRVPPHATGGAVDLTLVDMGDKQVDMGTQFNYFGPESAALYFEQAGMDQEVMANRKILRDAMQSADFRFEPHEWWHFDYGNQLWAHDLKRPFAIFGELDAPLIVLPDPANVSTKPAVDNTPARPRL